MEGDIEEIIENTTLVAEGREIEIPIRITRLVTRVYYQVTEGRCEGIEYQTAA